MLSEGWPAVCLVQLFGRTEWLDRFSSLLGQLGVGVTFSGQKLTGVNKVEQVNKVIMQGHTKYIKHGDGLPSL